MRTAFAATLLLLASSLLPATAAEQEAPSTIDAVTVFPQGSEVTRVAKITLGAGDHTVIVRDLPAGIEADSIRVQGEATQSLEIGAVDTRQFYLSETSNAAFNASERKRLEDELEALADKRQQLAEAIAVAEVQKQLMQNLAGLPVRPEPIDAAGGPRTPAEWGEIFGLIGDRLTIANKAIQDIRLAMREVDRRILDVQNQLNRQPGREDERTEVKIHLGAAAALEATLRIRYQVPAASWSPFYDARLESGDRSQAPKLALVRRAVIVQQTGEDWKDVALTLSSTRPQAGTAAPDLASLIVDFEPERSKALLRKQKSLQSGEADEAAQLGQDMVAAAPALESVAPPEPTMVTASEAGANVTNAPFQAIFVVADRQTIKAGEGEKRVQIDTRAIEPVLSIRAVPKLAEIAYLYAKMKLEPGQILLPGRVSLFRDGVFVGHGALPLLSGGEEHELGFGADDQVRIEFAALDRRKGEVGIISASSTETVQFKVTVKNLHERSISVRVLDQMPVSENEQIQVGLLPSTTKPTLMNVEDRRGVIAWDMKLEPDEEQVVDFGYQVSWPKDKRVRYDLR